MRGLTLAKHSHERSVPSTSIALVNACVTLSGKGATMRGFGLLLTGAVMAAGLSSLARAQSWTAVGTGEGRAARIEQPGPVSGIGFVCNRGQPLLSVKLTTALPGNFLPAQFMVGSQRMDLRLERNRAARQPIYIALLTDSRLLDMVRNAPASARLVAVIGQRTTAVLNLTNARASIDSALRTCMSSATGAAPGSVGKQVRPGQTRANMPHPGLYLLNDNNEGGVADCRQLSWDALFWYGAEQDPVLKIAPGESLPEGYRAINANQLELRQRDPDNRWQTHAYLRCDESVLPPDARYFDRPRSVASLPIKPGYYRLRTPEGAKYYLLDTNRIAWMEDAAFDSKGNVTRRTNRVAAISDIKQQGARVFTFSYRRWPDQAPGEDMHTDFMLIEAPDRLTGWFQEYDTIRYEPVTAAQVPAALRPRF